VILPEFPASSFAPALIFWPLGRHLDLSLPATAQAILLGSAFTHNTVHNVEFHKRNPQDPKML